jgi:hypothetical protein
VEAQAAGLRKRHLRDACPIRSTRALSAGRFVPGTLPFNGGATISDALWAGLPALTCAGEALLRHGRQPSHAVGLPELITYTLADHEALAL